ncbi:uncharacterized protein BDZ99DRAFT_480961 [Mytilinidion resinicola]|uniref:Uncharacterized protein n=1 Tax=Mytilinidion resinicola TaxID=574789 RepID=A0A6A6Y831_9PEZI|nr:uncharacterized protein BDZ99DRAFT_480961 [Mytilinidion resinicola]KAF2804972.1 hypothetical protein BDZ99DRAFT_480961 [Mytilinidion resinicola]
MLRRPPRQAVSRRFEPSRAQDEVRPCCGEARGGACGGRGRFVSRLLGVVERSERQSIRTKTQHTAQLRQWNRERKRARLGERATGLWHCCSLGRCPELQRVLRQYAAASYVSKRTMPEQHTRLCPAPRERDGPAWCWLTRGPRGAGRHVCQLAPGLGGIAEHDSRGGGMAGRRWERQHHGEMPRVGGVRVAAAPPGQACSDSRARTARAGPGMCRAACHDTPRWGRDVESRSGASLSRTVGLSPSVSPDDRFNTPPDPTMLPATGTWPAVRSGAVDMRHRTTSDRPQRFASRCFFNWRCSSAPIGPSLASAAGPAL